MPIFVVSIPLKGERYQCESSSVGRARPSQGRGREFESRLSLQIRKRRIPYVSFFARVVELVDTQDLKSCWQ
ncbi:MAG: hypothetical protein JWO58_2909 [Chitinophagaceae bacterium]|nr:hypothetical protein [Chitinophagaceae bacterium]